MVLRTESKVVQVRPEDEQQHDYSRCALQHKWLLIESEDVADSYHCAWYSERQHGSYVHKTASDEPFSLYKVGDEHSEQACEGRCYRGKQ